MPCPYHDRVSSDVRHGEEAKRPKPPPSSYDVNGDSAGHVNQHFDRLILPNRHIERRANLFERIAMGDG